MPVPRWEFPSQTIRLRENARISGNACSDCVDCRDLPFPTRIASPAISPKPIGKYKWVLTVRLGKAHSKTCTANARPRCWFGKSLHSVSTAVLPLILPRDRRRGLDGFLLLKRDPETSILRCFQLNEVSEAAFARHCLPAFLVRLLQLTDSVTLSVILGSEDV